MGQCTSRCNYPFTGRDGFESEDNTWDRPWRRMEKWMRKSPAESRAGGRIMEENVWSVGRQENERGDQEEAYMTVVSPAALVYVA